jgi:Tol biopolymer transport system component
MRRALAVLLITVPAAVVFPQAAGATLVYDKNVASPSPSVYVAKDDATGAKRIGAGSDPDLSPDGGTVVWAGRSYASPKLYVSPTATAKPRVLLTQWRGTGMLAWSPDSASVATLTGPEIGAGKLVVVDVADGANTTVATGYFGGVSFSPDGTKLVYAMSAKDGYTYDLYLYDRDTSVNQRLTTDSKSGFPVWGPRTIVFSRFIDASVRRYGPKSELYTFDLAKGTFKRLTNQPVAQLLFGLTATEFSADGSRLLAQFGGQDTSYAQVVNPQTGRVRTLGKGAENGLEGQALSHDGRTVLAATGGADPSSRHDIVTVPYAGGRAKVLVRNAFNADWNR